MTFTTFEGGKGHGKGKGLFRQALDAHNAGFEVEVNEPGCFMPRKDGTMKELKVTHIDDLVDVSGHVIREFDNVYLAWQDAWMELNARFSTTSKMLNGMVGFLMRFRHYDNAFGGDSQRFKQFDISVRDVVDNRVWCLKGDNEFFEIWLDTAMDRIAVEVADREVVDLIGQLYNTKSKGTGSHLF